MYRITGTIKGLAPILFNKLLDGELEPDQKQPSTRGHVTLESRIAKAYQKVHRNEHGIYMPSWNFKKCLLIGCRMSGLKFGRKGLEPFLAASVFPDHEMPFGKDEPDFIHEWPGRIPPGPRGAAVIVRRPAFREGWELPFGLNVVDDRRTPGEIRRSLDEAGLLVGLGSWRPEYGRFVVTEWNVEKEA